MKKSTSLTFSIIFSIVIIISAYLAYTFVQNGKKEDALDNNVEKEITKIEKINYGNEEKRININGKEVIIDVKDSVLYVNEAMYSNFIISNIYVTDYFVFVSEDKEGMETYNIFDEDGKLVSLEYDTLPITVVFSNLRIENNILVANAKDYKCEQELNGCDPVMKAAFINENDKFIIKRLEDYSDEELKNLYSKEDVNKEEEKEEETKKVFTSIIEEKYSEPSTTIKVNGKDVVIRNNSGTILVNNKEIGYFSISKIYHVNDLVFIAQQGQAGESYYVFDENGNKVELNQNNISQTVQYRNLRVTNGELYADSKDVDCYSEELTCDKVRKVEFVYEKNKITLRGIYTTNKEKFTKLEVKNFDGAENTVTVDGKNLTFKVQDGILYVNNINYNYFTPQFVYILDKIVIASYKTQNSETYRIFDSNGKEVVIDRNGIDPNIKFYDFEIVNSSLIVKATDLNCPTPNNCNVIGQAEFVYENGLITIYLDF